MPEFQQHKALLGRCWGLARRMCSHLLVVGVVWVGLHQPVWAAPDTDNKAAAREALKQRLANMPPRERQALIEQAKQRWDAMSPEEKKQKTQARRAEVEAMTPEQRQELQKQRRAVLERLSPEERRALRQKLQNR